MTASGSSIEANDLQQDVLSFLLADPAIRSTFGTKLKLKPFTSSTSGMIRNGVKYYQTCVNYQMESKKSFGVVSAIATQDGVTTLEVYADEQTTVVPIQPDQMALIDQVHAYILMDELIRKMFGKKITIMELSNSGSFSATKGPIFATYQVEGAKRAALVTIIVAANGVVNEMKVNFGEDDDVVMDVQLPPRAKRAPASTATATIESESSSSTTCTPTTAMTPTLSITKDSSATTRPSSTKSKSYSSDIQSSPKKASTRSSKAASFSMGAAAEPTPLKKELRSAKAASFSAAPSSIVKSPTKPKFRLEFSPEKKRASFNADLELGPFPLSSINNSPVSTSTATTLATTSTTPSTSSREPRSPKASSSSFSSSPLPSLPEKTRSSKASSFSAGCAMSPKETRSSKAASFTAGTITSKAKTPDSFAEKKRVSFNAELELGPFPGSSINIASPKTPASIGTTPAAKETEAANESSYSSKYGAGYTGPKKTSGTTSNSTTLSPKPTIATTTTTPVKAAAATPPAAVATKSPRRSSTTSSNGLPPMTPSTASTPSTPNKKSLRSRLANLNLFSPKSPLTPSAASKAPKSPAASKTPKSPAASKIPKSPAASKVPKSPAASKTFSSTTTPIKSGRNKLSSLISEFNKNSTDNLPPPTPRSWNMSKSSNKPPASPAAGRAMAALSPKMLKDTTNKGPTGFFKAVRRTSFNAASA